MSVCGNREERVYEIIAKSKGKKYIKKLESETVLEKPTKYLDEFIKRIQEKKKKKYIKKLESRRACSSSHF